MDGWLVPKSYSHLKLFSIDDRGLYNNYLDLCGRHCVRLLSGTVFIDSILVKQMVFMCPCEALTNYETQYPK